MDTFLYDTSIPYISSLQGALSQQAPLMQATSILFDPKYAFLIYSPIAYLLDQRVGRKLIMTTVIAEWLNMLLKWMLHGERPYWYIHSSGHFDPKLVPIEQFPITCELGPGHPSGHSMVTAAVWYIIVDSLIKFNQHQENEQNKKLKLALWSSYALLLLTVGVSRVFLACHFPHQCLAGALLGLLVARLISSRPDIGGSHFLLAAGLMLTTAFGTFALLQALGLDPAWTIRLATKHCQKREYIHLDTAPFFSIMRYSGFALGTGLALCLPNLLGKLAPVEAARVLMTDSTSLRNSPDTGRPEVDLDIKSTANLNNLSWFSARLLVALLMARLVDNLSLFISHANMILFYSSAFLAYTGFSFAFINL